MTEFFTIYGSPSINNLRPYQQYDTGIEPQLERAFKDGWRLVHVASFTPISTSEYSKPIFHCLLSRETP